MVIYCDTSAEQQKLLLLLDFIAVFLLSCLSGTEDTNVVKQQVI